MKVCEHTLAKAKARLVDAIRIRNEAEETVTAADAALGRLYILKYAAENPTFIGFEWSTEWEYNDEGYDEVVHYITEPEELNDDYGFTDLMSGVPRASLALMSGGNSYDESGSVTLAELRKARF